MNNMYDRCPNCMNPYQGQGEPCPYCGCDVVAYSAPANCLPPFSILQNKYMVGRVLGQGGFGITYIGYDMNLATYVAIKEYYPESISTRGLADNRLLVTAQSGKEEVYNKNLERFVGEARNLSKFYSLPGIVSVRNFFYENGTAYIVMDYVAGENLKKYLADNGGRLDEGTVLSLMKPVLESLYEIHKQGLIHRDISPDNIMFDDDGSIKLIDFGAVRGTSADMDMTYTVMLKHGYAPQEQYYSKGNQGPWTDIYSLCATMYKMLTGNVPPNCIERMSEDSYVPPSWCGVQISPQVEQALAKGLAVNVADRYQNIGELIKDLYGKEYTFMGDGQIGVNESVDTEYVPNSVKATNKKWLVIIASSLAALVLLFVCIKVFIPGKDGDKATTGNTTEMSSETTTEAITTEVATTEEVTAEETVKLEGQWTDYCFMIEDEYYELPMTYEEWESYGWVADMDKTLYPGELTGLRCHKGAMTCTATIANYGTETANQEDCYVIGFYYSHDYYETEEDKYIYLPGDVRISAKNYRKSNKIEEVMEKYGEPEYKVISDISSMCQYSTDEGSYMTFYGDSDGFIYMVDYTTLTTPEGVALASGSTVETLAYIESYVSPNGTTDRFDEIFKIDGVNYKIWGPVSQFLDNGWTMECDKQTIGPSYAAIATLTKGDASFEVKLANTTIFNLDVNQAIVCKITLNSEKCTGIEVVLPGGAMLGGSHTDLTTLYSDIDGYKETVIGTTVTQYLFDYGVVNGSISISATSEESDTEKKVYYITEYVYERTRSAAMSDLDNVDYIQGITIY